MKPVVFKAIIITLAALGMYGTFHIVRHFTSRQYQFEAAIPRIHGNQWPSLPDPHLGYSFDHENMKEPEYMAEYKIIPGFTILGDPDSEEAIKIVALGGSTTDAYYNYATDWSTQLYYRITRMGLDVVVYNGGVGGYFSAQELFKLIRDVIPLQPDLVISYSGVNDYGLYLTVDNYPYIHEYQEKIFAKFSQNGRFSRGTPNSGEPGNIWMKNQSFMHAICRREDINFMTVRQPVLGYLYQGNTPAEHEFLDLRINRYPPGKYMNYVTAFYEVTEPLTEEEYCIDLATAFEEGDKQYYRDHVHYTQEGSGVIADRILDEILNRYPKFRAKASMLLNE